MVSEKFDFIALLSLLKVHEVNFVVIGGVCAIMHGASLTTFDVDIVPERSEENLARLENALREMEAYYREHPPGRILPEAKRMNTPGHHLLKTNLGLLDVLGTIVGNRDYAQLLPTTEEVALDNGTRIRILDLPTLIQIKRETGREKDLAALPMLMRILKETQ